MCLISNTASSISHARSQHPQVDGERILEGIVIDIPASPMNSGKRKKPSWPGISPLLLNRHAPLRRLPWTLSP